MDDPELPVRVQSVLGLTEMVTVHNSGRSIILPLENLN